LSLQKAKQNLAPMVNMIKDSLK